ncbi:phosphotransferase [Streptomyces sp. NPDC048696]|uniref:phosphotransferase n=1 Tax=Streptomyces sp. NPDC048696 TaxID=3365585 RepID=UPI0037236175
MARYTTLESDDVQRLCQGYELTVHQVSPLNGGMANSSYLVSCLEGPHVLTVLDNHSAESAQSLVRLLHHLSGEGVSTPAPLTRSDGTSVTGHEDRPVIVKPYVSGRCHDVLPVELLPAAGAALAAVHGLPVDGVPDVPLYGRRLPADARQRCATFPDREFAAWLTAAWRGVDHVTSREVKPVLVHGDLFADNIVVGEDGELVILDWETASFDDPLIDLGMAVVGLCRVGAEFHAHRARRLVEGYARAAKDTEIDPADLLDAAVYASVVIAYHRYVRHHLTHPDPANHHLYREIPPFIDQMRREWAEVMTPSADLAPLPQVG